MSRKRSAEAIEALRSRFVAGALAQGVDAERPIAPTTSSPGFSGFGFPKHPAAFALLAYQCGRATTFRPSSSARC